MIKRLCVTGVVIAIALVFVADHWPNGSQTNMDFVEASWILLAISVGIPLLVYAFRLGWDSMAALRQASEPIPDPLYIAQELRAEWGREPTVLEVQAVHEMLTSRRNEAAVRGAVGFGAIFLLHDAANKSKGL
jgi:hypothetical protein